MASSASSTPTIWTHDVFLSFRGEDTRTSFTDHLYHALIQKGIGTFRDEENLKRGKSIGPVLLKAIEESRFAVVILSEDYASSGWCLDELAHIAEGMKERKLHVFPVFYHVKPSEVRHQTGNFSEAFAKHEENFKGNMEKVDKWRKALGEIAAIWGWVLDKDSKEAEVTQDIAEKISTILHRMPSFGEDLIGTGPRIEKMELFLDLKERDDVRTIGIWGMGGIGKTTLAELVYNKIRNQFQTSHFLHDVREESEKQGLVSLQNVLFEKLLCGSGDDIHNVHMGMSSLKRRLRTKKVLIVLDDVDHQKQVQTLVGNDWLGRGSRVIITTRNEQLLKAYGAHHIFEVEKLNDEEAFQLFCKKAFKKGHEMADDYTKVSKGFAKYTNGLPLAIEVLGGALCGKTVAEWESKFAKLKEYPDDKDIFPALRISYDGLEETEKQIFLDIACFFKGDYRDRVHPILDACNFHPTIGISVLQDKCLVKITEGNRLWMHDLLQQMGRSVVLGESFEPGKRSRLWVSENVSEYRDSRSWDDINTVLEDNLGTIAVHGMFLTLPAKEEIELDADPFSNMRGLKLLKICNANFSECPEYFSRQLRLLEWHEYPLESLPPSFRPSSLVELRLPNSRIKQLWHEMRLPMMEKLMLIDLSDCKCLTKTPDFSKAPNLMGLVLQGCEKLSELHPTIWDLQHLAVLSLKDCEGLESLPHSICLESLEFFVLSGCSRLERFPEIGGNMGHLSELHLVGTRIRELPLSIENLTGLIELNLGACKNLLSLPSIICSLASLKYLHLSGCSLIDQLPENIGSLELLKVLDACQTAIRRLPLSILHLKNLQRLCLAGCKGLQLPHSFSGLSSLVFLNLSGCGLGEGAIPVDIGICLSSLRVLHLSENNFESIPESISQLSELRELSLFKCCNLRFLPEPLPLSLKHMEAHGCPLQTNYPKTLNVWTSAEGICTIDCRDSKGDEVHRLPIHEEHGEQLLPMYFEDLIERQKGFELRVTYTRIPDWCSEYSSGTSVTIQLSDSEDSNSWMGVAVFVFFKILENSSEMEETFCHFHASDGRLLHRCVFCNYENFRVGSHAVCRYVPAFTLPRNLKKESKGGLRASVSTNRPSLKVKGCGIRLISHQDAAKFAHDFSQTALQDVNSNFGSHCKYMIDEALKLESSGNVIEVDYHLRERPSTSTVNQGRSSSSTTTSTDSSIQPVQSLLSKLYEGNNGREKNFFFSFCDEALRIPNWFVHHYLGNVALCDLPQNLFDESRWVGIELYAIVSWRRSLSHLFLLPSFLCVDLCDQDSSRIHGSVVITNRLFQQVTRFHEIVVLHVPRVNFQQHQWSQCQVLRAFFRSTNSDVEVEVCGTRLVYEEDLGELIRSLTDLTFGRSDKLDALYAQAFSAQTMENPMRSQRQWLAESGQEFLIPILHKYRCYLKGKHDVKEGDEVILLHSKQTFDNSNSTQQKVAEEDARLPLSFSAGHVHVLAETRLYGSYSPAQWKMYLQAFFQDSQVATLSLKGDKISVFKHFDPWSTYNFCFPSKEILEWFKGWTTMSSNIGIRLPPKLYDSGDWRGLAIISSFSVHEHPTTTLEDLGSQIAVKLLCHLTIGDICLNPVAMYSITKEKFKWQHVRGFIWVTYIPRLLLSEFSAANSDIVGARIYTNCPALTVHECGIRLLYEHEVEEFKQTISQSGTSFFDNVDLIHQFVEGISPEQPHQDLRRHTSGIPQHDLNGADIFHGIFRPIPKILEWFNPFHISGSSAEIQLPPPLYSHRDWMGFALYAFFSDLKNPTGSLDKLDPETPHYLICHLETDNGSLEYSIHPYRTTGHELEFLPDGGFIWVTYIPRKLFQDQLNGCSHLYASFASDRGGLYTRTCGFCLIYEHDEELFKERCMSLIASFFVDMEKNYQSCNGGEGEAGRSSRTDSSIQDPLHKRLYQQDEGEFKQAIIQSSTSFFDNEDLIRQFAKDLSPKHPHQNHMPQGPNVKDFDRDSIFNATFPPNTEILEWFSPHHISGPSVKIQLPPSLCSESNWMGLALCAFFSHLENPTASLDKLDAETAHYLICHLETEDTRLEPLHMYQTTCEEFKWLHDGGFIWLTYIPHKWFLDQLNGCSHLEASFASERGGLSAQSCGFRLVYQHDGEEFKQHCIRMTSLLVNQETNYQQCHEGESEAGPSITDSSIQDSHDEILEGAEGPKSKDKGKQVQVQEYAADEKYVALSGSPWFIQYR